MSKWNVTWASVEFLRELCSYCVWKFLQGFGVSQKPNIKKKKKPYLHVQHICVKPSCRSIRLHFSYLSFSLSKNTISTRDSLFYNFISPKFMDLSLQYCVCLCVRVCTIQVYLVTSWDRGLICALVPHWRKKPGLSHYVCFNLHMLKACRCRSSLCVNDGLIISCRRKGLG